MSRDSKLFITSPYSDSSSSQILGYAAYSHKILADKIVDFLGNSFDVAYVKNAKDLEAKLFLQRQFSNSKDNYLIYVGPPKDSWTSPLTKNLLLLTWEFPDFPDGTQPIFDCNWVTNLNKFDLVILPNRLLQNRLDRLGIPNIFLPIGKCIAQISNLQPDDALDLLMGVEGTKFANNGDLKSSKIDSKYPKYSWLIETLNRGSKLYAILKVKNLMPTFVHKFMRDAYHGIVHSASVTLKDFENEFFEFDNLSIEIYGKLVIGSWLNISDERKNFELIINAYKEVFKDDVALILVLKIIGDELELRKAKRIISDLNNRMSGMLPEIILLSSSLEAEILDALRISTHIYLNTSNAEGICMPALEHAINSVELVIPRNSAFLDYFSAETANFYEVDYAPTHFPFDPQKLHTTYWSPPIFRDLVKVLSETINKGVAVNRDLKRSQIQKDFSFTPTDFVGEIQRYLNDCN